MQTAERVSSFDHSDNVIFQRHLVAYETARQYVSGSLLEVGSGEGYGISILIPECSHYTAVDKFPPSHKLKNLGNNLKFQQMKVPPLNFENESFDSLVSFQVIEHIEQDELMIAEMARVLKSGGKAVSYNYSQPANVTYQEPVAHQRIHLAAIAPKIIAVLFSC